MDAVLNSPSTDYIYFCAKEDFSGYHRFASNYNDHMKNARLYQQALDARGIH
ncbi:MAG TPA: endolytic transglycosylase MltG [Flavipsychrobacter sp.]